MTKKPKFKRDGVIRGLAVTLVAIAFLNFFITFSLSGNISENLAKEREANRPAELELIKIGAGCENCFSVDSVENRIISSSNTNITAQKTLNKKEASDLIDKYNINKLPTLIVKGETDKSNVASLFEGWNGADVKIYSVQKAPYFSLKQGNVIGKVNVTLVEDRSCENCYDLNSVVGQIENNGVYFNLKETVDYNEAEGKKITNKYNIKKVPALIFNNQLKYYEIYSQIEQIGKVVENKLIMETPNPPFVETNNDTVKGLVGIIYLVDNSCKDCYDISVHKQILGNMGMVFDNETTVDVNTNKGQKLAEKYKIEAVPTTLISKEAGVYTGFKTAWSPVGKVVNGTYVFTSTEFMGQQGKYVDLETGKVKGESQ